MVVTLEHTTVVRNLHGVTDMPLYTYKCPECEYVFDKLQSYNGLPPECPKCGAGKTEKQLTTGGAFQITGEGVYKPGMHVK